MALKPEQVVRDHAEDVAKQLRRIFGPSADIDDVFQAVFVEVIRSLDKFRGKSKLKTWIHRITLNVAYQEMRMQYREREVRSHADLELIACGDDVESGYAQNESRKKLYRGLQTLDPKKRIAVILHDIEGYTLKEVGESVGRPLQTVASQVKSGRAELAAWFEQQEKARVPLSSTREVTL